MSSRLFACLFALAAFFGGAQPLHAAADARTQRLIHKAMRDFEPLSEFGDLYSNGFYFLKNENGRDIVEVRTLLQPCYELVMRIPVDRPYSDNPLVQNGSAEIELWEITRIYHDAGGQLQVDKKYPQTLINQQDWIRLYNADGNFADIGIELKPGMMLSGMETYRDQLRKEADVGW